MTCAEARSQLSLLVDEALSAAERAALVAHLDGCRECPQELEGLRATVRLVSGLGPIRAPAGFVDRVMAQAYPVPWYRRLCDRLFVPFRWKVPLEAVAAMCLAGTAVYVFQRTPEVREAVHQEARTASTASTPAAPAPPAPTVAPGPASGATASAPPSSSAGTASPEMGLRAMRPVLKDTAPGAPLATPPPAETTAELKKERAAEPRRDDLTVAAPQVAAPERAKTVAPAAVARVTEPPRGPAGGAAGGVAAATITPPAAAAREPGTAPTGSVATPPALTPPAVAAGPPPVRVLGSPPPAAPATTQDARQLATGSAETPSSATPAPAAGGASGVAAKSSADALSATTTPGTPSAANAQGRTTALTARARSSARLLRAVDASGRLVVAAPAPAEAALDALLARLGGARVARRLEGTAGLVLIDVTVPVARYPELTAGLARLGQWTTEHEVASLPAEVRVEVAITTEP